MKLPEMINILNKIILWNTPKQSYFLLKLMMFCEIFRCHDFQGDYAGVNTHRRVKHKEAPKAVFNPIKVCNQCPEQFLLNIDSFPKIFIQA